MGMKKNMQQRPFKRILSSGTQELLRNLDYDKNGRISVENVTSVSPEELCQLLHKLNVDIPKNLHNRKGSLVSEGYDHTFSIYIPSTQDVDEPISHQQMEDRKAEMVQWVCARF